MSAVKTGVVKVSPICNSVPPGASYQVTVPPHPVNEMVVVSSIHPMLLVLGVGSGVGLYVPWHGTHSVVKSHPSTSYTSLIVQGSPSSQGSTSFGTAPIQVSGVVP